MSKLPGHDQPVIADEGLACGLDPLLTIGCKRDVSGARVPPVQGPLSFAVADDKDAWGGHGGCDPDAVLSLAPCQLDIFILFYFVFKPQGKRPN